MQGELQDPGKVATPARNYEARLQAVREKVEGKGFHVVIEAPFVVAGDGGKAAVERSAAVLRTVRATVVTAAMATSRLRMSSRPATPDLIPSR